MRRGCRRTLRRDGSCVGRIIWVCPVIWDFAAPMCNLGRRRVRRLRRSVHHAAPAIAGLTGPVAFLNLGGVGKPERGLIPAPAFARNRWGLLEFDTGPPMRPIND